MARERSAVSGLVSVTDGHWRLTRFVGEPGRWIQYVCPFCECTLRLAERHAVDRHGRVTPAARCTHDGCGRAAMLLLERWDPYQTPTERSESVPAPRFAEVEE